MPGAKKKAFKHKQRHKKKQQQRQQRQQQQQQKQQQHKDPQQQAAQHQPVDTLLTQAETAYAEMRFDECMQLCDQVLSQSAGNTAAMETKALALLQLEQPEPARALLEECVRLSPEEGASKYMYLGQMSFGEEAAEALQHGISILAAEQEQMRGVATDEEMQEHNDAVAAAFCSLAEVYLTDLCETEGAQDVCMELMKKALDFDPNNVQALQTLASIHISLSEPEQAREYLFRSLDEWWKFRKGAHGMDVAGEGDDDDEGDDNDDGDTTGGATAMDDDDDDDNGEEDDDVIGDDDDDEKQLDPDEMVYVPPYEARINAAKMLIELGELDLALELLDLLIAEDDEIMQVWYLQGWTLHLKGDTESSRESLERAKQVYVASQADRPEVLQHIDELLAEQQQQQQQQEQQEEEEDQDGDVAMA
ncbi:hypothetical protein PTSG_10734 [Salpingoeca rosetta]|uniref:TPR domain-containing protein n=1 Tax=Salpingoeca rosetta (strain ATCC 50818 / BSB-021) TaxID=946362 RepID=F2UQ82_SALR5|nr:uncharacterized protein PTSG_10734 [Salpingoeca rosetta]EGD79750.1 hypothetical protein PTSG_10734 [Salpingoeca rosetta]|eukprot:XP_004988699.1 hypothetical protein PTSG_10734 [Salpingoeca rosetta]